MFIRIHFRLVVYVSETDLVAKHLFYITKDPPNALEEGHENSDLATIKRKEAHRSVCIDLEGKTISSGYKGDRNN